jgi:SAM-dependent methyltransferase
MDERQIKKHPKTYRVAHKSIRKGKTARIGRRGLHDLDDYYRGLTGFNVNIFGTSNNDTTYGEVTNGGILALVECFKRHAPLSKFSPEQRNFFDLGCGVGRAVAGISILVPEIRSNGIEIVPERFRIAQVALGRIHSKQLSSRIQIRQGSFLDTGISFHSVCWIFISNLSFTAEVQRAVAERLEKECLSGCVIVCCRDLPFSTDSQRFEKVDSKITIPMSWSATSTCDVYRRK